MRKGNWLKGPLPLARKVSGARLGIVGLGRIGQAIARARRTPSAWTSPTPRAPRSEGCAYTLLRPCVERWRQQVDFLIAITPGGAGHAQG